MSNQGTERFLHLLETDGGLRLVVPVRLLCELNSAVGALLDDVKPGDKVCRHGQPVFVVEDVEDVSVNEAGPHHRAKNVAAMVLAALNDDHAS